MNAITVKTLLGFNVNVKADSFQELSSKQFKMSAKRCLLALVFLQVYMAGIISGFVCGDEISNLICSAGLFGVLIQVAFMPTGRFFDENGNSFNAYTDFIQ